MPSLYLVFWNSPFWFCSIWNVLRQNESFIRLSQCSKETVLVFSSLEDDPEVHLRQSWPPKHLSWNAASDFMSWNFDTVISLRRTLWSQRAVTVPGNVQPSPHLKNFKHLITSCLLSMCLSERKSVSQGDSCMPRLTVVTLEKHPCVLQQADEEGVAY